MSDADYKLTRIGVFYDGNFFPHLSNYYLYQHQRRARINITGLRDFIRKQVAAFRRKIVRAILFGNGKPASATHDPTVIRAC